jgi:hypothetical protein
VLLAVALTLGCFSGFLGLLEIAFPKGQSLHALIASSRTRTPAVQTAASTATAAAPARSVAALSVLRRAVRSRPAGAITWSSASSGLALHDGDGVQTGPEGRAQIAFGEALRIELEKNTLVVVSDPEGGGAAAEQPRGVVIAEGALWARTRSASDEPLAITLPSGTASLAADGPTGGAMQISIDRDGRSTLAVHGGRAALQSSGKALEVKSGQFVRVASDGAISSPLPLPGTPEVEGPAPGAVFSHGDLPPRVSFRWGAVERAEQYRVRAASDPDFQQIVLDEVVTEPSLVWGRLKPGTFHWQVSAVSNDIDGLPSPPRTLVVKRDETQIHLNVDPPKVENMKCAIAGRAPRRAKVFVAGERVTLESDGAFKTVLDLGPGANLVVVEAVDAAGHSTYWSKVVYAKP